MAVQVLLRVPLVALLQANQVGFGYLLCTPSGDDALEDPQEA
jgi:hypothetical protein